MPLPHLKTVPVPKQFPRATHEELIQCCGAETFCFRSDFQKVSAPAPAPALTLAMYIPFITDFILKSGFFKFFMKEYQPNSHAGFYTI
jgi:hypothetical protein